MTQTNQDGVLSPEIMRRYREAAESASLLEALLNDPKRDISWYHDVARQVQDINAALPFVEAIHFESD